MPEPLPPEPIGGATYNYQVAVRYLLSADEWRFTPWALSNSEYAEFEPAVAYAEGLLESSNPPSEVLVLRNWQIEWAYVLAGPGPGPQRRR